MFGKFFGNGGNYVETDNGKFGGNKRNRLILFVIIGAVCVLAFSGRDKGDTKEKIVETAQLGAENVSAYAKENEQRLSEVLEKIAGAGKVEVMLNYDFTVEKILAQNKRSQSSNSGESEKTANASEKEENVLVYGSGNAEQPYVTKEKMPSVAGAFIVAEGAGDETVRLEIYEAVKALYGVSGHRVKVSAYAEGGGK